MRSKSKKAKPKLRLKYGNHRKASPKSKHEAHVERVCQAVHVYLKYFDQVKEMHKEYDTLLTEALSLSQGELEQYGLSKKNNFEKGNKAWKSVPMRMLEIERIGK